MANLTDIKSQQVSRDPIDPTRIAYLRIINDLFIIVLTLFIIFPAVNTITAWIVILSTILILITSFVGLILINRGRLIYGLGLVIYGLAFGFFVNSFLVEGWGIFSLFFIILFTLLTITPSIHQKRIIEAVVINTIIGIASFIIDINLAGAEFRIGIPSPLIPYLWMFTVIVFILYGILLYRRFPHFSFRVKLITSFVLIPTLSLGIFGLLINQRYKSILVEPSSLNLTHSTIIFGLAGLTVAIAIALWLTQIITKPIRHLTEGAKKIAQGNLDTRTIVTSPDEIGEISETFNSLVDQLQNLIVKLDDQVAVKTLDLEDRVTNLQVAAEITRDIAIESEMSGFLERAVTLISERFNLYHVGIYFIDTKGDYATIVAGNDVTGKQLVDNQHKYRIASDSNIGITCLTGEPLLAPNHEGSTQISYHPLLPNTATQMVLPLRAGDQILGAVDLHSIEPDVFQHRDIPIFLSMADQITIAINKIRNLEELQGTLEEQETTYSLYTRESWRRFIQGKEDIKGYHYTQNKVEPITSMPPEVIEAWTAKEVISQENPQINDDLEGTSNLAIPLKIRGEVIGVLNLQLGTNQIPTEIKNFTQELANRLSLVLENARLVEVAQRRVERERVTGEITDKIRQTLDLDSVLRAAVQEIGKTFDLAEVEVQMGDILDTTSTDGNGNPDNLESETDVGEA